MTPEEFMGLAENIFEVRTRNMEAKMEIVPTIGNWAIYSDGIYVGYIDTTKTKVVWL